MDSACAAGYEALRWVAASAVASDDLYEGTAGVLAAFAEARLGGITDFDDVAAAATARLRRVAATAGRAGARPGTGLYTGLGGIAWALATWADPASARAARPLLAEIAGLTLAGPDDGERDLLEGDAGVLLVLTELGDGDDLAAASMLADRIVASARWTGGGPDWPVAPDGDVSKPNFSHGAAGIGYALAAASTRLDRPDLLELAAAAGRRLVRLGTRPDGSLAVPFLVPPDPLEPDVSYGWCHGPAGTRRLFVLLGRLQPGQGWDEAADACLRAVRSSGLPARRYPGFWDNLGQCCGTAGVGELALDRYQETSEEKWLAWAGDLADDVLSRRIEDHAGVRWSHTEHRATPQELEPAAGWMQGAAGIAAWLLRLARVRREGPGADRLTWPDRP